MKTPGSEKSGKKATQGQFCKLCDAADSSAVEGAG